ncbi:MAG: DUF1579 family protein [Polyangiaceae bacterium]
MQLPSVPAEVQRLAELFGGVWQGESTDESGARSSVRWTVKAGLDGYCLIVDYAEELPNGRFYRGHGVHGWDPAEGAYLNYWFDNMGTVPRAANRAALSGNRYSYIWPRADGGAQRFAYWREGEVFRFTRELATSAEGPWRVVQDGRFTRVTDS